MNTNSVTLFQHFCRACMNAYEEDDKETEGKKFKTISIYNEPESMECKNVTIMELLMLTTPELSIDSGDMLPKTLCELCLERLINAYKFQKMCIRVERKFREMIEEIPVEAHTNKDPLNAISVDNVLSQDLSNLNEILKIEVDEPLIDQNGAISNKIVIEDTEELKFETDTDNIFSDRDTDWKNPYKNVKSKKVKKGVKNTKVNEKTWPIINNSKATVRITSNANDSERKNFECDDCGNCFSTRKSLKRHKRIHLRELEVGSKNMLVKTKYECEFCQKVFQQSSSLKDHLRTHTGEQPYLCSECGKAFKSLSNMKQHFLRHGTDRPYVCPECPKRFPCLSDLASHKAVHNKTKSHVCDICGAAFVKPYLLKKHNMYHTGEKNHKCDYCDMRFVLADQCRRHMRTHTGEKPYKCKYCERAFAQSNDLIKHLRGHLGDNVYKCELCPQGFRLQGDLRVHFNTHKNDDEETRARNLQDLKNEEHRLQMKFGLVKCT